MTPQPDLSDLTALAFLDDLYRDVDAGFLSLFSVDRTDGKRYVDWSSVDDRDVLAATAIDRSVSCCTWLGVATRKAALGPTARGGVADCAQLPALFADIDIAGPNHKHTDRLPQDATGARLLIESFPLPPTCVVDTGGGYQPWWLLAEPLDVDERCIALLTAWGATWATLAARQALRVDNVFNVDRVMRLPGTVNRKTTPTPVVIAAADWTRRYGLDDIDAQLLEAPPQPTPTAGATRRVPYTGLERPGDAFNASTDANDLLAALGFTYAHSDPNGDRHWTRPGKEVREGTSATVYADDGHITVWSDTVAAQWAGLETRRPYDPFGFYVVTQHGGDWTAATRALRDRGYGAERPLESLIATTPAPAASTADATTPDAEPTLDARFVRGGTFILDAPDTVPAVWGADDMVLWAQGEGLIIAGPPGVGKTTLAGQVLFARLGLRGDVLGYPVTPTTTRVLYLASDRPAQIRRSLRRLAKLDDRAALDERLVIWPGPPPADLAKRPELLIELARSAGADTVFLDSLKDMAIGISDDDVGAGLNHAMQRCLAAGVEVAALHHQRKGQAGQKPKTLEDLYGSTWLAAGAGSVILLWGTAGDAIVELEHLKQPSTPVGPLKIEHEHHDGTTTVYRGFDALAWLRNRGPEGGSATEAARAMHEKATPTDNERKAAQRRLDALVRSGLASRSEGVKGGLGGSESARYRLTDNAVDGLVLHVEEEGARNAPF